MVKRREISVEDKVKDFADGADQEKEVKLDPNAPRKYKAIRVPFNEHEYRQLEDVAKRTGRTKLNAIRWAIAQLSQESK